MRDEMVDFPKFGHKCVEGINKTLWHEVKILCNDVLQIY